jgi:hypothetical protein
MRADIGLTQLRVDSSVTSEDTSDWGRGVLGGVGFGHPITDGTRLLFQVNYGWRRVKGDSVGTLNLTLGGLW